eukprot:542064_1
MIDVLLYEYILFLFPINGYYYLSQLQLDSTQSHNFCATQCNADLASFHSSLNFEINAMNIIKNSSMLNINDAPNIWFGLNDKNVEAQYEWNDGSTFDYGNMATKSNPPWACANCASETQDCFFLNAGGSYGWSDEYCDGGNYYRQMCNSCDSSLNKYIIQTANSLVKQYSTTNNNRNSLYKWKIKILKCGI